MPNFFQNAIQSVEKALNINQPPQPQQLGTIYVKPSGDTAAANQIAANQGVHTQVLGSLPNYGSTGTGFGGQGPTNVNQVVNSGSVQGEGASISNYAGGGGGYSSNQPQSFTGGSTEINYAPNQPQQQVQTGPQQFTGQVQSYNQGIPTGAQYYYQNAPVGGINYQNASGGGYTVSEVGNPSYSGTPGGTYQMNLANGQSAYLSPDVYSSFQSTPGEIPIFNRDGDVIAINSRTLGQTVPLRDYPGALLNSNLRQVFNSRTNERVITDANGNPVSVRSNLFRQSMSMDAYSNALQQVLEKGYWVRDPGTGRISVLTPSQYQRMGGQGTATPVTPEDVFSIVAPIRGLTIGGAGAIISGLGFAFRNPISNAVNQGVNYIIPEQKTGFSLAGLPRQVGRGVITGATMLIPGVGEAYIGSLAQQAVTNPQGTVLAIKDYAQNNPYELASMLGTGKVVRRVGEVLAREKVYNGIADRLIDTYGINSREFSDFQSAWKRAFSELPKRAPILRSWSSRDLEALPEGDVRIVNIINDAMQKYGPQVIGSTTILPQTTLRELPRTYAGDVDIQNVPGFLGSRSRAMANELYNNLKNAGYDVRIDARPFVDGNIKYHITLNGKELINIGTSTSYFLKTQIGPLRGLVESERFGQFSRDPGTGVQLGGARGQLRIALVRGYEADISRIPQLEKLAKAGKLIGEEKRIVDALGIKKGTDYLFNDSGRYIGPKMKYDLKQFSLDVKAFINSKTSSAKTGFSDLLIQKARVSERGYNYPKTKVNPNSYLISYPKEKPGKTGAYKKPSNYDISKYLTRAYNLPKSGYRPPVKSRYPSGYKPPRPITNYLTPSNYKGPSRGKYPSPPKYPKRPPTKYPPIKNLLVPPVKKKISSNQYPVSKPKRTQEKRIKKKSGYTTLPTVFEELTYGLPSKKARARINISGFEAFRFH